MTMDAMPNEFSRVLAVAAHPDDLEYGLASAVARWTDEGKTVAYALATSGEAGIQAMEPEVCGPLREDEERAGAAAVGVDDIVFFGHPDGAVEYGIPLRRDIAAAIRRTRAEIVVSIHFGLTWGTSRSVNHVDHRVVGLAVLDACRDAANRWMFPDAGDYWEGVRGVYVAGTATPTHYLDVTASIDRGVASLRAHKAYIEGLGGAFDPDAFLRESARAGGETVGCEYAVLFEEYSV